MSGPSDYLKALPVDDEPEVAAMITALLNRTRRRWIRGTTLPSMGEQGTVTRIVGDVRDIPTYNWPTE